MVLIDPSLTYVPPPEVRRTFFHTCHHQVGCLLTGINLCHPPSRLRSETSSFRGYAPAVLLVVRGSCFTISFPFFFSTHNLTSVPLVIISLHSILATRLTSAEKAQVRWDPKSIAVLGACGQVPQIQSSTLSHSMPMIAFTNISACLRAKPQASPKTSSHAQRPPSVYPCVPSRPATVPAGSSLPSFINASPFRRNRGKKVDIDKYCTTHSDG